MKKLIHRTEALVQEIGAFFRAQLGDYGVWVVALLFVASFPLSSLYHIADDLEAARRLHLFAKYTLVATGFGLAVWACPPQRAVVRSLLALFFASELWDGLQYTVCRLSTSKDTTESLAEMWGTGVPKSLCERVFGEYPLVVQVSILFIILGWILWRYKKALQT